MSYYVAVVVYFAVTTLAIVVVKVVNGDDIFHRCLATCAGFHPRPPALRLSIQQTAHNSLPFVLMVAVLAQCWQRCFISRPLSIGRLTVVLSAKYTIVTIMVQMIISSIEPLRARIGTFVPLAHIGFVSLVVVPVGGDRAGFVLVVFRHAHGRLVHLNGSFDVVGQ